MNIRPATQIDKETVLAILDEFRSDCIEQATGKPGESNSARTEGAKVYESLLARNDYGIFVLENETSKIVGIITGYLCPMMRNGGVRAEVEEFFVQKTSRGNGNAKMLMDAFFEWAKSKNAQKVNLESDNDLKRAHGFYTKYGFEMKAQRFVKKLS
ncbi:MAG: GNAT family N-acetyltransferase [Candidatus Shapirobacteria bacterium]|jgi:GNAT superfamily N-acetyltransferase